MAFFSSRLSLRVASLALAFLLAHPTPARAGWSFACNGYAPPSADQPDGFRNQVAVRTGTVVFVSHAAHFMPWPLTAQLYEVRYRAAPSAPYETVSGRAARSAAGQPLNLSAAGFNGAEKFRLAVASSNEGRECTLERPCAGTLEFRNRQDHPLKIDVACHRL